MRRHIDRQQVTRPKSLPKSISPYATVPAQTLDLAASALRIAAVVALTGRISVKPSVRTGSSATERGAMQVTGSDARRIALVSAGGSAASAYLASPGPATKEAANPIKAACVKKRDRRCRIGAATHHFQKAAQHNFPCASGLDDGGAVAGAIAGARMPSAVLVRWNSPGAALRATIRAALGASRSEVEQLGLRRGSNADRSGAEPPVRHGVPPAIAPMILNIQLVVDPTE